MQSLPDAASKLLSLGVDLRDVVRQTTATAAAAIHREDELGTLRVGTVADLAAFEVVEGDYEFRDVHGEPNKGTAVISPVLTVRAGRVYRPEELRDEVEREALHSAQLIRALGSCDVETIKKLKNLG